MEMVWVIAREGKSYGPLTHPQFIKFVELGHLQASDYVWHSDHQEWISAQLIDQVLSTHLPPDLVAVNSLLIPITKASVVNPTGQINPKRKSCNLRHSYSFGFWPTLVCWIFAIPLSIFSIFIAQTLVSIWAWLNGPDAMDILSLEYWIFGIETKTSYLGQMIAESVISFFREFVSYSVGLLFTFWCFIYLRQHMGWKISVSSIVMFLCIGFMLVGLGSLGYNLFYSWKVYELGILQCNLLSSEFYKCNVVLLEIPRIIASISNIMATAFAGQVYGKHLNDTDAWIDEVGKKVEDRMKLYGAN